MCKSTALSIALHSPKTDAGTQQLSKLIAEAHANAVLHHVDHMSCPSSCKHALLTKIIQTVRVSV